MTERKIMEREIKRFPIIGLDFSSRILKNFQFFGHRNYELDEKFLCLKKSGNSKFSSGISRTSFPKNLTQSGERCITQQRKNFEGALDYLDTEHPDNLENSLNSLAPRFQDIKKILGLCQMLYRN